MGGVWSLRILLVAIVATSTFLLMEWLVGGWEW